MVFLFLFIFTYYVVVLCSYKNSIIVISYVHPTTPLLFEPGLDRREFYIKEKHQSINLDRISWYHLDLNLSLKLFLEISKF